MIPWPEGLDASALEAVWRERGFDPRNAGVLLAVSGGADSLALAHFFAYEGRRRWNLKLAALHVNHGWRGAESDADESETLRLCAVWKIPARSVRLDPQSRRPGESAEMAARRERYRLLEAEALLTGSDFIATAHHRGDQAETLMLRILRGTGFRGLGGIPFLRGKVWRPLLGVPPQSLRTALQAAGIAWREDSSNADLRYRRNWARHCALPAWEAHEAAFGGGAGSLVSRLAVLAEGVAALQPAFENWLAQTAGGEGRKPLPGSVPAPAEGRGCGARESAQDREPDSDAEQEWEREWLGRLCAAGSSRRPGGPLPPGPFREWTRQVSQKHAGNGFRDRSAAAPLVRVSLGPGRFLSLTKGEIGVESGFDGDGGLPNGQWASGNSENRGYRIGPVKPLFPEAFPSLRSQVFPNPFAAAPKARPWNLSGFPERDSSRAWVDADKLSAGYEWRTRRIGDRFSPLGVSSHSRKLKVFLQERKIPRFFRDRVPLLAVGDTVVWVAGHGISDHFKVTPATERILELEALDSTWQTP